MKTMMKGLMGAAVLIAMTVAAQAALCERCREMMFTADIGTCKECGANTSSGGFKLCPGCSQKLGQCQACRNNLKSAAPAQPPAANPAEQPQGVQGKVIKMTGDFMPTVGRGPKRGNLAPLAVPVHVFKGKVKVFQKPDPKHPQLVKIVQAGKDGTYRLDLPPGEYTVVAEINGALYLNSFDGQMNWSTVTVAPNKWTTWDIKDSSDAVF